ncbi:MAG: STAS domain-containing protein [Thermoanaerobaculia bacterium]
MLKIEKTSETAARVTFFLSGRISADHVPELNKLLRKALGAGQAVTLDLEGVGLVDRKAVEFFTKGEGAKSKLLHCPVYVREWLRCEGRKVAQ